MMSETVPFPQVQEATKLTSKSRRPTLPVLIVEDREENQMLLAGVCKNLNIEHKIAENGSFALDLAQNQSFSLFIVDLMMPVMDGKTFVSLIKQKIPDAVILIQTALDSPENIIEIMRMGVYDYLVKPLNLETLKTTLLRALEYRYLIDLEKNLLLEESKQLREHLEWLNYKESARKNSGSSIEMTSIHNLKTTLSQGSGFGTMTTLIDTICQTAEKIDENNFKIDAELFALLEENNDHTKSMLRGLNKAVEILENKITLEKYLSSDILRQLSFVVDELNVIWKKKSILLSQPFFKSECTLHADLNLIAICIKELLLNAIKYAPVDSHIDTFVTSIDGYFCLSIKNQIKDDIYSTATEHNQKDLIQPFFRLRPPVEEVHKDEPFSLGLGLTMVDYIANKHNGMFFIRKAKDHTTKESSLCTIAELFIPIQV
jgi:DNA-binding response OmpR family regulator